MAPDKNRRGRARASVACRAVRADVDRPSQYSTENQAETIREYAEQAPPRDQPQPGTS